jgi:hypothetical protein
MTPTPRLLASKREDDLSSRKRLEQTEVDEDIWTAMVGPTVGFVLCCLHATHHCKDARVKKGHHFALRVNSRFKDGVNQAAGPNLSSSAAESADLRVIVFHRYG